MIYFSCCRLVKCLMENNTKVTYEIIHHATTQKLKMKKFPDIYFRLITVQSLNKTLYVYI